MEELPGNEPGIIQYFYRGYAYFRDVRAADENIYCCLGPIQCNGTVRVDGQRVIVIRQHLGHPRRPNIFEEAYMQSAILRLCRETLLPFGEIYEAISSRYDPQISNVVTQESMQNAMENEREASRPAIPRNLTLLGPILRDYRLTSEEYRGIANGVDGTAAMVFASNAMMQRVNEAFEVFITRHVHVAPQEPGELMLWTVFIARENTAFPVFYIIANGCSFELLVAMWQLILDITPGMRQHVMRVTTDCRRAMVRSIIQVWPEAIVSCSWFYFCMDLYRSWILLGLRGTPAAALWMAMALPLAPYFEEGLRTVTVVADETAAEHPAILRFMFYLRTVWLPLRNIISVPQPSFGTHLMVENIHRQIAGTLGGAHRNLWVFFEKIKTLIRHHEIDWHAIGPIVQNFERIRVTQGDARIERLQNDLAAARITIKQFLQRAISELRRNAMTANIEAIQNNDGEHNQNYEVAKYNDFLANDLAHVGMPRNVANEFPNPIINLVDDSSSDENSNLGDHEYRVEDLGFGPDFGRAPDDIEPVVFDNHIPLPPQLGEPVIDNAADPFRVDENIGEEEPEGPEPVINNAPDALQVGENIGGEEPGPEPVIDNALNALDVGGQEPDAEVIDLQLNRCSVCLFGRPCIFFDPCHHLTICLQCNDRMADRRCPICREQIAAAPEVYFT